MRSRFARSLAAALLLLLSACSEWAVRPLPQPGPRPARIAGRVVRVTRVGGEVLNLSAAEVRGDSLYGIRVYSVAAPFVTLPLSEVTRLETEGTNVTIPGLLGAAALVVLLRWMFMAGN